MISSGTGFGASSLLDDAAGELFETLANASLRLDPLAEARLHRLEGRSILIHIESVAAPFAIRFTEAGITISRVAPAAPSVTVHTRFTSLWALLAGESDRHLRIDGDETLLVELRAILRELNPDPAGPLAPLIGEQAAGTLADAADLAMSAARSVAGALAGAANDLLRDQGRRHFLDRDSFETYLSRAWTLRQRFDRLEARVHSLETDPPATTNRSP